MVADIDGAKVVAVTIAEFIPRQVMASALQNRAAFRRSTVPRS